MFYVSKITPLFFILAFIDLFISFFIKVKTGNYIHYGQIGVFGFILNTVFGAFYQVIPNSQQKKLPAIWICYIVFIISILSSLYFYYGNFEVGYFFVVASVLIFAIHVLTVVRNITPLTVKYISASLIFLIFSAIFLFLSLKLQNISVQVAIHTFTVGVMINAVLGVQTAWIPMIYMQPLGKTKTGRFIINNLFYIHQLVILGIIFSFFIRDYKVLAGFAIFEIAVVFLFLKFVFYDSIKPQYKLHGIPYTVKYFIAGHIFLISGLIIAHIVGISNLFVLIPFHIDFMVYGFGLFTIIGGMLHLTPRIIFNMKQSKKGIPLSRGKFELLFKVVFITYILFIAFDFAGYGIYGVILFFVALAVLFINSIYDFFKMYIT